MAHKKTENKEERVSVLAQSITREMKEAYLDYAMSVITTRALPDVRDGLKPVHRRILYAMHKMGLTSGAKFRKSAAVVGDVLGKYHPHGDTAVYDSMVKMAQDFSFRYPLIIGQGNFGSIDGDNAAAMRYTEAKMSRLSGDLLLDIEKDTVDFRDNYDGSTQEPSVLPAGAPSMLLNGTLGIAVGMATNIPPHNLSELVAATMHLIDDPEATTEDLLQFVKGPDFPTGAMIFGKKDIHHAYANGRGGILVRGHAEILESKGGKFQILITSLPYRVNKADLIIKIADLVKNKKIDGIRDIRDESTSDIRIVIDLKNASHGNKILNQLYKHTQLEDKFHVNMVALVDGVPQTLSLKAVLEEFIKHRQEVVRRRTQFDLLKAHSREHILLGLKKALDHIDEIIALIKKSRDRDIAKVSLMKTFKFSEKQSEAILQMQLQRLAGLERKKIEDELKELQELIEELQSLLKSEKKMLTLIKSELTDIESKYGDERRTKVVAGAAKNISLEDMIPDEPSVLVYTAGGYIKRTNPDEYRLQRRGGVGVVDLNTKEEDAVIDLVVGTTHNDILFFTDRGKVYKLKMYDLPEGKRSTKGKAIANFIDLSTDESVTSIIAMPLNVKEGDFSLALVTKTGIIKRVGAAAFHDVRRSGLIAINLKGKDQLVSASFVSDEDELMLVSALGQSVRFNVADVRQMGRTAAGVRGMKLKKGDEVIASLTLTSKEKDLTVFVISENGYGKKTELSEYTLQKRGGSGLKTANITAKTGKLIAAKVLSPDDEEIVAMSQKSQAIRVATKEVSKLGRSTQGVRIMKLRAGDKVASLIRL